MILVKILLIPVLVPFILGFIFPIFLAGFLWGTAKVTFQMASKVAYMGVLDVYEKSNMS